MDTDALHIRPLARAELDIAVEWAAAEGWNPGLHDADVFWATDPEGFLGAELDGELVATGSVVSYAGQYGFMGFFIVRPELRGQGIGTRLWFHRRDHLKSRLAPGAAIGMDGVFDMQDWYAKGGFEFSHRNLRMQGVGREAPLADGIIGATALPVETLETLDRAGFGCGRPEFLRRWLQLPESRALACLRGGQCTGFGVIRRCRSGYKIGPLFAEEANTAAALFDALAAQAVGEPVFLDVPENNPAALELAAARDLSEVFGCARMVLGPPPPIDWQRVFGITTFELG